MSFTPRTSYGNFGSTQWMNYAVARTGVAMPNCFTYATARISEIVGSRQSLDGSTKVVGAGQLWATHASEFAQSSTPVLGALMIFQGGVAPYYYGHVAVVEGISGGRVTFSESSYREFNFRLNSMSSAPGSYYPNGYGNLKLIGYLVHKSLTVSDIKLTNENGTYTLAVPTNKRRDSPTGIIAETLPVGKKLSYTNVTTYGGSRYISWVETEPNGNKYRYFVAVSGSEKYGVDQWATFGGPSTDTTAPQTPTTKSEIDESNVKHWGVDLSEHNIDSIDLSVYDFAIIRCCYGENTDKKLDQWIERMNGLKKPYGLYVYDYAINDDEAKAEAQYTINLAKKYKPELGVWLDMEDADEYKKKRNAWTKERAVQTCKIVCKAIKDAGFYTGIYSSTWFFENWFNDSELNQYDKWVAKWDKNDGLYHSDTSSMGTIHQYTSIDSHSGLSLDKNAMYVDFDHYKVDKTSEEKPSNDKPSEPQKEPSSEQKPTDGQSDVKELNGLLKVLIGLLKKLLSIFGKSGD